MAALVPISAAADWPTYHFDLSRTGNDPSSGSATAVAAISGWPVTLDGDVYAEPLVVGNTVLVATENNSVYALDAAAGAVIWHQNLGTPVPGTNPPLPCGNINPVGITGTPVVDVAAGVIYVVAFTWTTNQAATIKYTLYALNLNNSGAILFHDDIIPSGAYTWDATIEGQRGALALNGGYVDIPFGGRYGDCNSSTAQYRGWVVGAPTSGAVPSSSLRSFPLPTSNGGGGMWAASGIAIDGSGNLYVTTGNTACTSPCGFDYGEAVMKLSSSLGLLDYFAPTDWSYLNQYDIDLGSVGPALLPNGEIFQVGKAGDGYLVNQASLGGVSNAPYSAHVCPGQTADAAFGGTAWSSPYVYVPCTNGVVALSVDVNAPSFSFAWQGAGGGPPIVAGGLVWTISAGTLYGLDPSTGATAFSFAVGSPTHFATPAYGGGRLYVPEGTQVGAFQFSGAVTLNTGVDVSTWGTGHLDAFARASDGALWQRPSQAPGGWGRWTSLGSTPAAEPGAVSWGSGRIDVFTRGQDNALWHRFYDVAYIGGWSAWENLGGNLASGPDAASWTYGRLDVFARASDNSLLHRFYDRGYVGGWSAWENLGGNFLMDPGVVSWGFGRLDVFARGPDNTLLHRFYDRGYIGGWSAWENLGGALNGSADPCSWAYGRLDVFSRAADNTLLHRFYDRAYVGGWSAWENLGGALADDTGATSWGTGRIDLVSRDASGNMVYRFYDRYNGGWSAWQTP